MLDFIELKTVLTVIHILGVALGAGGAFMSDGIFISSIKDEKITKTEFRFITLGSRFVWGGLSLLVLSGASMFLLDPQFYLASAKFLAKMTVVAIITTNGIVFHHKHIPLIKQHIGMRFSESKPFIKNRNFMLASGALSTLSWATAITLGVFRNIPFSYITIMSLYASLLIFAVSVAMLLKQKIIPNRTEE